MSARYAAGCPSARRSRTVSNGIAVHLENHDVALSVVSRRLFEASEYKRRMGWTFPWASSLGGDFNFDFNTSLTEQQQAQGPSNTIPARAAWTLRGIGDSLTKGARGLSPRSRPYRNRRGTYTRESGMSAFVLGRRCLPQLFHFMRAGWTASGACTVGSTARQGAQRDGRFGGAGTMSMTTVRAIEVTHLPQKNQIVVAGHDKARSRFKRKIETAASYRRLFFPGKLFPLQQRAAGRLFLISATLMKAGGVLKTLFRYRVGFRSRCNILLLRSM